MSTHAAEVPGEKRDVRTILVTGIVLGAITAIGVTLFALISRAMTGRAEIVVQSLMVLIGGAVATYVPARSVRPQSTEAIGWSAFIGVVGAWTFTILDIVVLRSAGLYSWRWDAIGGGSAWWYLPVWWMGATLLAWLGALVYVARGRGSREVNPAALGGQAVGIAILVFGVLALTHATPLTAGAVALAFALAVAIQLPVAAVLSRR